MSVAASYLDAARGLVGQVEGPFPPVEHVDATIVRLWREVIEDRSDGPDGIVPPGMLQVWEMPGFAMNRGVYVGHRAALLALLDEAGFVGVAATHVTRDHIRPLRVGEDLRLSYVIESVGDLHRSRLGEGHFVVWRTDYADAADNHVASAWLRLFKFRPAEGSGSA